MSVREAAALRRAEEFKRYYPLTDGDGELVYEYFLAHVTHEGPVSYTHLTLPTIQSV